MTSTQHLPRRYKQADYRPVAGGFAVLLDDKPLEADKHNPVIAPTEAMAIAVVAEWQAQTQQVRPENMPLSQLLITACSYGAETRLQLIEGLLRYLETELICHYGTDDELVSCQRQLWQPLHNWVASTFGVMLPVTFGVQPMRAALPLAVFEKHLHAYSVYQLAACSAAVAAAGSLIIGLAIAEKQISAAEGLQAAEAEADFQAIKWGSDAEAQARRASIAAELQQIEIFLGLLVA